MAGTGSALGAGGIGVILLVFLADATGLGCGISPACPPAHTLATLLVVVLALASPAAGVLGLALSVAALTTIHSAPGRLVAGLGVAMNSALVAGGAAAILGWL